MGKKNKVYLDDSIGTLLRKVRKKAKLTQADMAKRFGIAEWLYSKYEKDILEFDVELFSNLLEYEENTKDLNEDLLRTLLVYACVEAKERELYSMSEEEREKEWERVITELAKFREELEAEAKASE